MTWKLCPRCCPSGNGIHRSRIDSHLKGSINGGALTISSSMIWEAVTLMWHPCYTIEFHDDVIKWKYFPRYWPFVRGIHRSPVNSPHKCQWRGALMFSLICAWIDGWVNNPEAGDLRRYRAHYDVTVMYCTLFPFKPRTAGWQPRPITPTPMPELPPVYMTATLNMSWTSFCLRREYFKKQILRLLFTEVGV